MAANKTSFLTVLTSESSVIPTEILQRWLAPFGATIMVAEKGKFAKLLQDNPTIDVIVASDDEDAITPDIINRKPFLPIITTASSKPTTDGLYYHIEPNYTLSKQEWMMLNAVKVARTQQLSSYIAPFYNNNNSLNVHHFYFQTFSDVETIGKRIIDNYPDYDIQSGLLELMYNAIEHGNLGIDYIEKKCLMEKNTWQSEIAKRLRQEQYKDKTALMALYETHNTLVFYIADEGDGFDWEPFLEIQTDRMLDPNGRGIALANAICFDEITYLPPGNKVIATISKKA